MSRGLVTSSRYSPGNMTGDALERLFVGRDALMKDVLKRIAASATGKGKHCLLLVGPRGIGKTHFVSLAYHKLKTDAAYAQARERLKIAYLNEEEWGVASFLDLLVRILRALVAEDKDPGLAAGVERIYQSFKKSPEAALEIAQSLLIEYVGEGTLLLICENLSDLFEGLGDEGQMRWRSFMHEHPFWTLLATTPALFSGVTLQSSPFHNFFTIKSLERLDFDTATELLCQKAAMEGRQGLADFLLTPTGRARVRAIHHLAGGNHRVYVILSDFLDEQSLEELVGPFMRMADDLTPYYQERMRQLSPQQRKIIELLCLESRPLIVKDIAMRCLISQQVAAKRLGELAQLRFVSSTKVGRESYYELAEPLMRICVDIKDNRTEHFRLFVEFLRHWFSGNELRSRLELLRMAEPEVRRFDRLHLSAALRDFSLDPREPFLEHLDDEARRCFESGDYLGLVDALPRLLRDRPSAFYYIILSRAFFELERFDEALSVAEEGTTRYPHEVQLHRCVVWCLVRLGRFDEAVTVSERVLESMSDRVDPDFLALRAACLLSVGRFSEALECGRSVLRLEPENLEVMLLVASALRSLGRNREAELEYRRCLEFASDSVGALSGLCALLASQRRWLEVVELAESEPEVVARSGPLLVMYGSCLEGLGRFEEALVQLDRAIALDAGNAWGHLSRAIALVFLGRELDAVASVRTALRIGPIVGATARALNLLVDFGDAPGALSFMEEWEGRREGEGSPWVKPKVRALLALSRYEEARDASAKALEGSTEAVEIALLWVEALVGSEGFGSAMRGLDKVLGDVAPKLEPRRLGAVLLRILSTEGRLRGAVAMARQVRDFRAVLERHQQGALIPALLSGLLEECLEGVRHMLAEWAQAVPLLQEAFADRADCRIPLDMLSVVTRYAQSGETSVLLELPLEQRTLLLEKLGAEPPAGG